MIILEIKFKSVCVVCGTVLLTHCKYLIDVTIIMIMII